MSAPRITPDDLTAGYDPSLDHVTADEPASKEEEELLGAGVANMMEFAFESDDGLANIVQVLNQPGGGELWQKVPEVAVAMLTQSKTKLEKAHGKEIPGSVWFGEGGMVTQSVDLLFDIATQEQIPGYDDQDQYAASLMGVYKAVGEHIIGSEDQASRIEAESLARDMALTNEDGSMQNPESYASKEPLAESIQTGLLSMGAK